MSSWADFWKWLWSKDRGKPNLLTRAGIPRFVTSFLTFLLFPYFCLFLTPGAERAKLRILYHEIFFLFAYIAHYIAILTDEYIEFRFHLKGLSADVRFRAMRRLWSDPVAKIYWLSFVAMFVLFMTGAIRVFRESR